MRSTIAITVTCIVLVLAGCASNIPREIQYAPPENPSVEAVRDNIDQYTGSRVRWGGRIASVDNRQDETRIEVVATELGSYGRPGETDSSLGRFMVRIDGFIDPQIYAEGRALTVAGEVEKTIVGTIGEHEYTYPLISADTYYLWPQYAARDRAYYYRHYYGYPHHYPFGYGYPYHHPLYPHPW